MFPKFFQFLDGSIYKFWFLCLKIQVTVISKKRQILLGSCCLYSVNCPLIETLSSVTKIIGHLSKCLDFMEVYFKRFFLELQKKSTKETK